ncbi:hypothetical protein [Flavobacterium sp. LB2P74]|uniref:hypothetical protein n=1 Tax=Flavobacterium sp. LB2P74 TaxID=3401717 RepID=UPI003AADC7F8
MSTIVKSEKKTINKNRGTRKRTGTYIDATNGGCTNIKKPINTTNIKAILLYFTSSI